MVEIKVLSDPTAIAQAAAEYFVEVAAAAVQARGRFVVAFCGGSTPQALYSLLATDTFVMQVDWRRVHAFWTDERCVPPDHPDSNYGMVCDILLDQVPIPQNHIHRIPGEMEPALAAAEYENRLRQLFWRNPGLSDHSTGDSLPRFDLILICLSCEKGISKLFPAAASNHDKRWVLVRDAANPNNRCITLSPGLINSAAQVMLITSDGGQQPPAWLQPADGRVLWLVDQEATVRSEPS